MYKAILARLSQRTGLKPVEEVPAERRPYGSRDAGLIMGRQGLVYGPEGVFSNAGSTTPLLLGVDSRELMPMVGASGSIQVYDEERVAKNQHLWNRWEIEVIPAMIQPLLKLLSETSSMRDIAMTCQIPLCGGCANGRLLPVLCVFF